jgi:hypothetical protein
MRPGLPENRILGRARFTLGAIDHHNSTRASGRNRSPLGRGRKMSATSASQPNSSEFIDQSRPACTVAGVATTEV